MPTVAIIDYGSGNLRSAAKAFEHVAAGAHGVTVTSNPSVVARADRVVLPGQGAFADCRTGLLAVGGMMEALTEAVRDRGRPFLGVCVGMQLMAARGLEHGETPGFDWIPGDIVPIDTQGGKLKVPHMGWNELVLHTPDHPVFAGIGAQPHAYFVHSFHFAASNAEDCLASTEYGNSLTAIVGRGNMLGTQFHPEKSQETGLKLIENFLAWHP